MSTNQPGEIKRLLEMYLDGSISNAGKKQLAGLLSGRDNDATIEKILDELTGEQNEPTESISHKQEIFQQVLAAAVLEREGTEVNPVIHINKHRFTYRWIKIAAAVLVIVGAYSIFRYNDKPVPVSATGNITAANTKTTPVPGGNKAMLTLANGTTIILNSLAPGQVAQQNGLTVTQVSNGQLAYGATPANLTDTTLLNTLTTPKGGQYIVVLPDQTKVWLNAASSLQYPISFAGKTRTVKLQGEAYFEVAKNATQPFIVDVNAMKVTVLGTHFNVMAYTDEDAIRTTLLEGSVSVTKGQAGAIIKPGQQASLQHGKASFTLAAANVEETMAWKNGEFMFDGTPVQTIMRQVSRWYDVNISYDNDLPNLALSGLISRKKEVSELLEILEATHLVRFTLTDNTIRVAAWKKN